MTKGITYHMPNSSDTVNYSYVHNSNLFYVLLTFFNPLTIIIIMIICGGW